MRLLILGGTLFLGRHLVEAALARGHAVTLFNRGRRPVPWPEVESLCGDRRGGLAALRSPGVGRWDAAVDTSGYTPGPVRAAARLLADRIDLYAFVSTVSVYARPERDHGGRVDEGAPVKTVAAERLAELEAMEPSTAVTSAGYGDDYGGLKALCEQAALGEMGGRALIVRPGLLVGPHDSTDRFTYWPGRIARGGEVLAPGGPGRIRQILDARDLAEWMIRAIESGQGGTFNAAGPASELTLGNLLEECRAATDAADARFTWVSDDFLLAAGVTPWSEIPLWLPAGTEPPALVRADCRKAIAAGLTFRPLAETVRDTLAWDRARPPGERHAGLDPGRERALLRSWHGLGRASERGAARSEP